MINVCGPSCKVLNAVVGPRNAGDLHQFLSDQLLCVFRATNHLRGRGCGGLRTPAGAPAAAPDAAALHPAEIVLLLFSRSSAVQRPGARRCVTNTARSVRTSRASVKVEIHLGFSHFLLTRPITQQFIWGAACCWGGGGSFSRWSCSTSGHEN